MGCVAAALSPTTRPASHHTTRGPPPHTHNQRSQEEGVHRAILVVAQNLTPFARSVVADMQGKQVMEVFTEAELLVNITKHMLVPSHRILSPEEKATLLARYKVKESQLPRIQVGGGCLMLGARARGGWAAACATGTPPPRVAPIFVPTAAPTSPHRTPPPTPPHAPQLSDPVARYYGLQRGQVVRIVRSSETAGRYVTYRWCV